MVSNLKAMPNHKVRVLYVAGYSYSCSTLLSNILGNLEGFFFTGELRCIWDKSLKIRYEDFISQPEESLRHILKLVKQEEIPFTLLEKKPLNWEIIIAL